MHCTVEGKTDMTPRMKGTWFLAGFGVLAAMVGDGREAHAGSTVIVITGGYKPGSGDPPYDYIFQVYLEPPDAGTNTITTGDSFTIDALPGVSPANQPNPGDPASPTSEPNNPPATIWVPSIGNFTTAISPYASDITWAFNGNTPISAMAGGSQVPLGQFVVETTASFSSPPLPNGYLINYSFSYDGLTASDTSSFPIFNLSVPEPASVILLLAGAGTLSLYRLRERQRQRRCSRQAS